MANELTLPITAGALPPGFCPSSEQERLNQYQAVSFVTFPSTFSGIILSATKPADTTRAWGQLDQYGRLLRIYNFANGSWVSLHPTAPGLTMWWFQNLPNFAVFDGGDANPIGDASGPMWQQAKLGDGTLIAAKFPITAGALPSGANLVVGGSGGEEKHAITIPELPKHTHKMEFDLNRPDNPYKATPAAGNTEIKEQSFSQDTGSTGGDVPMSLMPPYVVGYLLQRTSRQFYSVT